MALEAKSSKAADQVERADHATAARFVERFADVWGRSDFEGLMSLIGDDAVLVQPTLATAHGKAAARDAFSRLFTAFPNLRATVHSWAAEGDVVFIEFTLACDFGGSEMSWPAVDRFVLRDGLVAERINYFDPLDLFLKVARRPRGWAGLARARLRPSIHPRRPEPRRWTPQQGPSEATS